MVVPAFAIAALGVKLIALATTAFVSAHMPLYFVVMFSQALRTSAAYIRAGPPPM